MDWVEIGACDVTLEFKLHHCIYSHLTFISLVINSSLYRDYKCGLGAG